MTPTTGTTKTTRRGFLAGLMASAAAPALANTGSFPVTRSDDEWRRLLSRAEYDVMRGHGTERRHSSDLLHEDRAGTFHCRGCGYPLYSSETKFDSRTGWPSFYAALPGAIGTSRDTSGWTVRTEAHCATCGSHLGHIFADGPAPTGHRHCINGVALIFQRA